MDIFLRGQKMAKAKVINEIKITLYLSEKEALYIRNLCQNHLGMYDEPDEERDIRQDIFQVLHRILGSK